MKLLKTKDGKKKKKTTLKAAISFMGIYPQEMKACSHKKLYPYIYSIFTDNY